MKSLSEIVRPHLLALAPRPSGTTRTNGEQTAVRLDANESPFNAPLNRYPDSGQQALRTALSVVAGVRPECIFPVSGGAEAVDTVLRVFCRPAVDNVAAIDPTCEIYAARAAINDVEYRRVPLDVHFNFSADALLETCDERTKVVFLCSPNSPTGNLPDRREIERVLAAFGGIVVVDEAYIDFAGGASVLPMLTRYRNLVVLRSFSKAWAMAGVRIGAVLAAPEVAALLKSVAVPCNVGRPAEENLLEMFRRRFDIDKWIKQTLDERTKVMLAVSELPYCRQVFPSQANFFLCRVVDAGRVHAYLAGQGIAVRNCSELTACENCLRLTIGLPHENNALISALRNYPGR
ncbi:MAG: aminotransferase class I/II-fold pyridoxal phosphate-dependent enzyme [Prevotellaceae bacterium]|nr:aminotransferase class I/II-fold pyridoxal phosphate-dependent enzyme [Prevotellaceae bacterium]